MPSRTGTIGRRFASVLTAVACLMVLLPLAGCFGPLAKDNPDDTPGVVVTGEYEAREAARAKADADRKKPYVAPPTGATMFSEEGEADPLDRPEGEPVLIWKAGNDGAIEGGGGKPPTVKQDRAYFVTEVCAYHWNNGKGAPAGEITLRAADGTAYGPWKTTLRNEVYWIAQPNQDLPAGTYTFIDSDPSTWAQNSASGGAGMGWAYGIPVK